MSEAREATSDMRRPMISVVLPLFNEAAVLRQLAFALREIISNQGCDYELLFVNDGSTDDSPETLDRLALGDSRMRSLHLSRNFGHQAAVQAGLAHASGDAVVVMDTDLQDDPEAIISFIRKWREGFDVVYAIRAARKEPRWKRVLFSGFYRLLNGIGELAIPKEAGNFCLLDRRVAVQVAQLPEYDRFFPGLRHWVGFAQTGIVVERRARHDDRPRVSLGGLFRLAKTAIFSFSRLPLTAFYAIALLSLLACGGISAFSLYHRLLTGLAIPGWTSIAITASFFGALNALGIGILGEYVVRIYDQVRARPRYIVARRSWDQAPVHAEPEAQLLADTQAWQREWQTWQAASAEGAAAGRKAEPAPRAVRGVPAEPRP